jgi:hypothetical protein
MKFNFQGRAVLPRGLNFWRRGSAALPLLATILFFTFSATAQQTNNLSDAEIQGRNLTQQLLAQNPVTNFTQSGILKIRDKAGNTTNVFISFQTQINTDDWKTTYEARRGTNSYSAPIVSLTIIHKNGQPNQYFFCEDENGIEPSSIEGYTILNGNETMIPFAHSDFWICDLGLEFFHWPEQKILKKENRRSRACSVLESTNPDPSANGYSRVISWIDEESGGIVHAGAYDFKNKLLKEFDPKSFKKVNGQWELQEMEIDNVQTGSRTRLEFTGSGATNSTGAAANPP